jgi:predicted  nucleic acid-binding Zn-ribbon protein
MGITQGKTKEPAERKLVESDLCWLCLNRDQRERPSVCICSHCSYPLCSDCVEDRHSELPQNITQLSNQFHEVEQLFETKQNMVEQGVSKSKKEIKQCFKTYRNDLLEAHHMIIVGIENERQNAKVIRSLIKLILIFLFQKYLNKIHSELQTISDDIETLSGERIVPPNQMEALLAQLNDIQKELKTYEATKNIEPRAAMPKYTLKFKCRFSA